MAKELPYYKHEPTEWLEGEIQICSDAAIVCFTNLCSGYWIKLGCMSYAFALHKYCRKDAILLQELIDSGIVDIDGDEISIKFLDNQLKEFNSVSKKRSAAASSRWNNANAMQMHSKSNAIREDKIREEEIIEDKTKEDNILLKKETKYIFSFKTELLNYGFDKNLIEDWLKVRQRKKATNTKTAFDAFIREVEKCSMDKNEILKLCIERDWKGFQSEWLNNKNTNNNGTTAPLTATERNQRDSEANRIALARELYQQLYPTPSASDPTFDQFLRYEDNAGNASFTEDAEHSELP